MAAMSNSNPASWGLDKLLMIESCAEGRPAALEQLGPVAPRGREILAQVLDAFESPREKAATAGVRNIVELDRMARVDLEGGVTASQRAVVALRNC